MITNFGALLEAAKQFSGKKVLVVFPNNEETFGAIRDALEQGLAGFILVGSKPLMEPALTAGLRSRCELHHAEDAPSALRISLELVAAGKADTTSLEDALGE